MPNDNSYLIDYGLPYTAPQVEPNHSNSYQQQEQVTFEPTAQSFVVDMKSMMYAQLQEINSNTMTGMVTASPGIACFPPHEPGFFSTPNSDMMGLCTTSAESTQPGSSSRSTTSTDVTTTTTNAMTVSSSATTLSSSPSYNWTPTPSPTTTPSTSLNAMNGSHLLPPESSIGLSYMSPQSPSLSQANYVNQDTFTSKSPSANTMYQQPDHHHHHHYQQQHQQYMHSNQSNALGCPSFMPMPNSQQPHCPSNSTVSASCDTDVSVKASTNDTHPNPLTDEKSKKHDTDSCDLSNSSASSNTELRRQIHIQSEQKRRAQIKDGFEELRNELPTCLNKKMSKVTLLHRTVQHIQHLKTTEVNILNELERLMNENNHLRKFQETTIHASGFTNN